MAKSLDEEVEAFRSRPLDGRSYPYLWVDALAIRVREGGRVVKVCCVVATAVNAEGQREIVGLDTFTEESGPAWTAFLRDLVARGLSGVRLVVLRLPQRARGGDRGHLAAGRLAAMPHALHAQRALPRAQVGPALRGHPGPHDLRAAVSG
jgi:hypothetical protein